MKTNWFPTLNAALESEHLVGTWPLGKNLSYGESFGYAADGEWISIYRETNGLYERPVHYPTLMPNTYSTESDERIIGRAIQI